MFREAINHSPIGRWRLKGVGGNAKATYNDEAMLSFFQSRLSWNCRSIDSIKGTGEKDNSAKVRAIFVSDMHLGTRSCRADLILAFLKKYEPETLYLVGDIIDGWRLKKSWYWPELHEEVLRAIMAT